MRKQPPTYCSTSQRAHWRRLDVAVWNFFLPLIDVNPKQHDLLAFLTSVNERINSPSCGCESATIVSQIESTGVRIPGRDGGQDWLPRPHLTGYADGQVETRLADPWEDLELQAKACDVLPKICCLHERHQIRCSPVGGIHGRDVYRDISEEMEAGVIAGLVQLRCVILAIAHAVAKGDRVMILAEQSGSEFLVNHTASAQERDRIDKCSSELLIADLPFVDDKVLMGV